MKELQDVYKRTGGNKPGVVRVHEEQEIPSIYSSDPAARRALNTAINNVHINRNRCKR